MIRHSVSNQRLPGAAEAPRGRPRRTSRGEVASAGLRLFVERGFEATTLDDVASSVGISRRTLLRYFASKNDIVWGTFDERLAELHERLASADRDEPILDVLRSAVVEFNDYGADVLPELRERMTLIIGVPALQGHAMLRYADWCTVIAEFVAARLGLLASDYVPQLLASSALGVAMATYRYWIEHPGVDLLEQLDAGFRLLGEGFRDDLLGARRGR